MRDQVERGVERRDRRHRPDRETADLPQAALPGRDAVERDDLTVDPRRLLCGDSERRHRPVAFEAALPDRLPRLVRDLAGELLAALGDPGRDGVEQCRAPVRRLVSVQAEGRLGRLDRALDVGPRCRPHARDHLARVGIDDVDRLRGSRCAAPSQDQVVLGDRARACHDSTFVE